MTALVAGVIERWFTPAFRSQYPESVEKMTTALRETDPGGYAGCCAAIRNMDLRNRLPSIEAPNLVVSGAEDPTTLPGHGRLIRDAIPGALRGRPGAAHIANVERPEKFIQPILNHLEAE